MIEEISGLQEPKDERMQTYKGVKVETMTFDDLAKYIDRQHEDFCQTANAFGQSTYQTNREDLDGLLKNGTAPEYVKQLTQFMRSQEGERTKKVRGYWTLTIKGVEWRLPHLLRHYEKKEYDTQDIIDVMDEYAKQNERVYDWAQSLIAQAEEATGILQSKRSELEDTIEVVMKKHFHAKQAYEELTHVQRRIREEREKTPHGTLAHERLIRQKHKVEDLLDMRKTDYFSSRQEYIEASSKRDLIQNEIRSAAVCIRTTKAYEIKSKYQRHQFELVKLLSSLYGRASHLTEVYGPTRERIVRAVKALEEVNNRLRTIAKGGNAVGVKQLDELEHFFDNIDLTQPEEPA